MHNPGEVIIPIVLFLVVFGIIYVAIAARNRERLSLIEKGADASIFYGEKSKGTGKWILTWGIFAVGIALGILVGAMIETSGVKEEVAFTSSIFFFGGAALVGAYFLGRRINGDKK